MKCDTSQIYYLLLAICYLLLLGCDLAGPGTTINFGNPHEVSFNLLNSTGKNIRDVSIKFNQDDLWREDLLSLEYLPIGAMATIVISEPFSINNRYDLKAIDDEDIFYSRVNVKIVQNSKITLSKKDKHPVIRIANNTSNVITRIHQRNNGHASWGTNLYHNSLPNHESIDIQIVDKSLNDRYDVRLIQNDGITYTKLGIKITSDVIVTFSISDRDPILRVYNNTGYIINRIFIKYAGFNAWRDNLLLENLYPENTYDIQIKDKSPNDRYDIQFFRIDDVTYTKNNIQIKNDLSMEITSYDLDPIVKIQNNTGFSIIYLSIKYADIGLFGENLLTGSLLPNRPFNYQIDVPSPDSRYDIRMRDVRGVVYTKWGVSIPFVHDATITFTSSDADPSVTVQNNTDLNISWLLSREHGTLGWGVNQIIYPLMPGRSTEIQLIKSAYYNNHDIQLRDDTGVSFTKTNLQIANNDLIVFTIQDRDITLTIANNTSYTVHAIYIYDSGSTDIGLDLLSSLLQPNTNINIKIVEPNLDSMYNIVLLDIYGHRYAKYDNLITDDMIIVFTNNDLEENGDNNDIE